MHLNCRDFPQKRSGVTELVVGSIIKVDFEMGRSLIIARKTGDAEDGAVPLKEMKWER